MYAPVSLGRLCPVFSWWEARGGGEGLAPFQPPALSFMVIMMIAVIPWRPCGHAEAASLDALTFLGLSFEKGMQGRIGLVKIIIKGEVLNLIK